MSNIFRSNRNLPIVGSSQNLRKAHSFGGGHRVNKHAKTVCEQAITNDSTRNSLRQMEMIKPFMQGVADILLQSSDSGAHDYGNLLLSIMDHFPTEYSPDTMHIPERVYVFSQGEVIFDFSEHLSKTEERLLNTGPFKKLKLFLKKGIHSSKIGEGSYGSVFKSLNVNTLVERMSALRDHFSILLQTAKDSPQEATSILKKTLKEILRDALVADKKDKKNKKSVSHLWGSPEIIAQKLKTCESVILPFISENGRAISELAVSDLDRKLKPTQALNAIGAGARALKNMHDLGVVHRDLKPENMVLTRKNDFSEVKLIDLDMARISSDLDHEFEDGTAILCGTLGYVAPEAFDGSSSEGLSKSKSMDLYAFGVTCLKFFKCLPYKVSLNSKNQPYLQPLTSNELRKQMNSNPGIRHLTDIQFKTLLELVDPDPKKRPTLEHVINVFPIGIKPPLHSTLPPF